MSASAAPVNGVEVDRGHEPVDAEDLLALPDRVGVVFPGPAHRPIQHVRGVTGEATGGASSRKFAVSTRRKR